MYNAIKNIIKKAFQAAPLDDVGSFPVGQASYYGKTSKYEQIYPYGFAANAPKGTFVLMFDIGGEEQNLSGIPYSSKTRYKNLKPGEVALGNFAKKTIIKFDENGNIIINAPDENITIESGKNITIKSGQDVNIESANAINITASANVTLTANNLIIQNDTTINGKLTVNGQIQDVTGKLMSAIISQYNAHTHISTVPPNPTGGTSNPV